MMRTRVANLLAAGRTITQVARELGISPSAVCYHARRIAMGIRGAQQRGATPAPEAPPPPPPPEHAYETWRSNLPARQRAHRPWAELDDRTRARWERACARSHA